MMILTVAAKTLKEAFRQPRNLFLTLGLPVAFMVIFGLAFGGTTESTYKVAVINHDTGALGAKYVEGLASMNYSSGKKILAVSNASSPQAVKSDLESRKIDLLLVIPANFSADLTPPQGAQQAPGPVPQVPPGQQPQRPAPPKGATVDVQGDPGAANFNAASQIVGAYTQAFAAKASGQAPLVRTETTVITAKSLTPFDFIAPGLMIYAVLAVAPQAASALARETELKTLDRIRASPMRAASLLGGVAVAEIVLAAIGMALMLVVARLMGFHNQGSYAFAFVVAIIAAFAVVGLGMLIASFAKMQQEAANLGVLVTVIGSFLSGAFFPVPGVHLFTANGVDVGLYDVLPTTHAVRAMREIATYGRSIVDVSGYLLAMTLLAALYFGVGLALYRRARLAPE